MAGFAGVAAAFGGPARSYDEVDLSRLKVLFACSGAVIASSLAVISLGTLGLEAETIFVVVGSVLALVVATVALRLFRAAYRNTRDRPDIAPPYVLGVAAIFTLTFESLLVLNMIQGGSAGLVSAALALSLLYGFWVFVRLMTRPT